jgi:uncharacterized membrane protein YeaQ/YmgE (transglycosylase-associated protein family)
MPSLRSLAITLLVGALAGWLSGLLTKGRGFGAAGNVVVGVIGAFLGQFLFGLLGLVATSLLGQLIFAVAGALIFVYLLSFVKR